MTTARAECRNVTIIHAAVKRARVCTLSDPIAPVNNASRVKGLLVNVINPVKSSVILAVLVLAPLAVALVSALVLLV